MFTNILCAVDFSEDSERALAAALALARVADGHVTLVTVVDPLLHAGASAAGAHGALNEQTQRELQTLLDRAAPGLAPARVPAVAIRVGAPSAEIVAQAEEANADVIVMGMRGIGGAQRLLLGSTSQHVLERATVPVLVVPPAARR
ncbi:MAG: universal stress protein [Vicinamibacterales bacterium]